MFACVCACACMLFGYVGLNLSMNFLKILFGVLISQRFAILILF